MDYTIVFTKDLNTNQELDLVKKGNKYYLFLTDRNKKCTVISKAYNELSDAKDIYTDVVGCFIDGIYTFKERTNIMNEDYFWKE